MSLTCTINGTTYPVLEKQLKYGDKVDERSTLSINVLDTSGTATFQKFQPITITDSILGVVFTGIINQPQLTQRFWPSVYRNWTLACVDQTYRLDKVISGKTYKNQYAGTIFGDQIQRYGAAEHVSAAFALRWDELYTEWQQGTLSGTIATTNASDGNIGGGDLELAIAGSVVGDTEQTYADFSTGTLSSLVPTSNGLILNSRQGIMISGTNTSNANNSTTNSYIYYKIWLGSYIISSNDHLQYFMWIDGSSPVIAASVDGVCSDGTTLRDFTFGSSPIKHVHDQNNFNSHPNTVLKGWADNQWYFRDIDLTSLAGKTLKTVTLAFEGDKQGQYTAYFHDIVIVNGTTTKATIYTGGSLAASAPAQSTGYSNFAISTPLVYDQVGYRCSPAQPIGAVGVVSGSQIGYVASVPGGTSVAVSTSFDGGVTYQPATNLQPFPNLPVGTDATLLSVKLLEVLSITGNAPTITPTLSSVTWSVNPSYSATKHDSLTVFNSATAFNSGTYSDIMLVTSPNAEYNWMPYGATQALVLNGAFRNWNDETLVGQTNFGLSGPGHFGYYGQLQMNTNGGGNDTRDRFDFAGQWQNFCASVDVQIPQTSNEQIAMTYRTTNWDNHNNTFAYVLDITQGGMTLDHGNNSGSSGTFTNIASASFATALPAGSWHTLKMLINGNSHTFWLDEVQYISATDSTFPSAGYIGTRCYNPDTPPHLYFYDNFGITSALSLFGTWTSPGINLNSVGTVGTTLVQWDNAPLPVGCSITAQVSLDGGTTYQPATNGGTIPQLPPGTSTTGKTLLLQFILATGTAGYTPALNSVSVLVTSAFSSTGTRHTAPVAYDTMIRGNVGSGFGTATNGQTYTQIGTGTTNLTSNEAQIVNTTGDVHMQTNGASGSDMDGSVRFSFLASTITAGMELRYIDTNNYYRFSVSTTTLHLTKVSAGIAISLATAVVSLSTGTHYWLRYRVVGNNPVSLQARIWQDGTTEPTTWNITAND